MSTKHVRTAADPVRFGCSLKVECSACGWSKTLTAAEAASINPRASLDQLRARSNAAAAG